MLPVTRAAFEAAIRRRAHKRPNPTQVHVSLLLLVARCASSVHCWQALRNIYLYFPCFFVEMNKNKIRLKKMQKTNYLSRKSWLKCLYSHSNCILPDRSASGIKVNHLCSSRIWFSRLIKHGKSSQNIHDPVPMTAAVLADLEHTIHPETNLVATTACGYIERIISVWLIQAGVDTSVYTSYKFFS